MLSGLVPQIWTNPSPLAHGMGSASRAAWSFVASFSGVCPPNCTMIPFGRSFSMTFSTSSSVSGSKYSRLLVS